MVNKEKKVVMKKIEVSLTHDGLPMDTLREVALLKKLDHQQHPNIVRYVVKNLYMVFVNY